MKLKFSVKYFISKCKQTRECIKSYFTLSVFYQLKIRVAVIQEPVNLFGMQHCVKSVRIQSFSGPYFLAFGLHILRISLYAVQIRENTHQKNSEYGHFSRNVNQLTALYVVTILPFIRLRFTPILYYQFR